jgi:hypothetical protein
MNQLTINNEQLTIFFAKEWGFMGKGKDKIVGNFEF